MTEPQPIQAAEPSPLHSPSGRWRFSLRSAFLLILFVALFLSNTLTYERMHRAERELRILRNEAGHLTIDNRNLVHGIAVDTGAPLTWRWRLYLPKGRKYQWRAAWGPIPADGVPNPRCAMASNSMQGGTTGLEALATVGLRRTENGDWALSISARCGATGSSLSAVTFGIPDADLRPLREAHGIEESRLGSGGTQMRARREPVILLKRRVMERFPNGVQSSRDPMPGIMVWLEECP